MSAFEPADSVRRVAVVHFTAPPAIGGIEDLMTRQCVALQELGYPSVCVAGNGSAPPGARMIRVPCLDPSSESVVLAQRDLGDAFPAPDHPLVHRIAAELDAALIGCTDCWVHNALTVSLNPFLSVALTSVIRLRPDVGWVAWTADLSAVSRFVDLPSGEMATRVRAIHDRVTWVAISAARRRELSQVLRMPENRIQVIAPPLDLLSWFGVGEQTRTIAHRTDFLSSNLVILVPAKALTHKGLDRAVRVGVALARTGRSLRVLITAATSPHQPQSSEEVRSELRFAIQAVGAESSVFLLADVLRTEPSFRTVRELMQLSDVLLLPSLEEGYGMPLLEAAACRLPVVCSNLPVFREVAGAGAAFFEDAWDDDRVASLVLSAADIGHSPRRRIAAGSVRRFRADLENLLARTC